MCAFALAAISGDENAAVGQKIVKLSKSLDGLDKQEIASKLQAIAAEYCEDYLEPDDKIANLDEYDGLELYDEDEDEDEED